MLWRNLTQDIGLDSDGGSSRYLSTEDTKERTLKTMWHFELNEMKEKAMQIIRGKNGPSRAKSPKTLR